MADYDSASEEDERNYNDKVRRSAKKHVAHSGSVSKSRSRSRSPVEKRKVRRSRSRSRSRSGSGSYQRVHIGDIDSSISEKDVKDAFGQYGSLAEVWVATYAPYFAFAVFKNRDDAEEAVRYLNGTYIRHCKIRVSFALPRRRPDGDDGGDRRRFARYNNYGYGGGQYRGPGYGRPGTGNSSAYYRRGGGNGYGSSYGGQQSRTRSSRGRSPSYDRYSRSP